jgi:hypothetical protein
MREYNFRLLDIMGNKLAISKEYMKHLIDGMLCEEVVKYFLPALIPAVGASFVVTGKKVFQPSSLLLKLATQGIGEEGG